MRSSMRSKIEASRPHPSRQSRDTLPSTVNEKASLIERIESRSGLRQLSAMAQHKMGTSDYELITID